MQTDFHLFKRMQSLALNTEVAFGLYGRHLEKSEVKFQYGGSPFSETGSSFILAVD